MEHFYQHLEGWFDFQDLYADQVAKAKDGDTFIEVGSYKGKSAAFMAVEIINSGKKIRFICVDKWEQADGVYEEFLKNIEPVKHQIDVIRDWSTNVKIHADFIFIDADHSYQSVLADIKHFKKYSHNIGGHDYSDYWPGVRKAVQEQFVNFRIIGNSWLA